MKKQCLGLILIINILSIAYSKPMAIENFTRLASSSNVQISPDGNHISVVVRKNNENLLAIFDKATLKPIGVYGVHGDRKSVGDVYWVNNKRLIYSVYQNYAWDKQQFSNGELIGVNIDGSEHKTLFGYKSGKNQPDKRIKTKQSEYGNHEILDLMRDDKKNVLLAFYPWRLKGNYWVTNKKALPILYLLNTYSGKKRKIGTLPLPLSSGIVDKFGEVRIANGQTLNGEDKVFYRDTNKSKWSELIFEHFEGENIDVLSFSDDNKSLYLTANIDKGTQSLFKYSLISKKIEKLFQNKKFDITTLSFDFTGKHIHSLSTDITMPKYFYINDNKFETVLHKRLMNTFSDSDVIFTSTSDDTNTAIIFVYSNINPGSYYLVDTKNYKIQHLFKRNPLIDNRSLAKTENISFKARDGIKINGYFTKPNNPHQEKLPMIVLPHGGPHGVHDKWGYNWQVQLLANKGYAVLQINFRGSSGFGTSFQELGHGNWGTSMQNDITDGTIDLINRGIVDSNRICIFGASYGAYAALTGVYKEPDLYKCAIGSMGVYNLPMMFLKGDIPEDKRGINYLNKVLGDNTETQKQRSPVYNVEKIKANVLLIHGIRDNRAPIAQAKSLMKAFDKIGKKYQWIKINDEAHGYFDEENRKSIYTEILKFLDQNIGTNVSDKH